jgi:hypothetical protein
MLRVFYWLLVNIPFIVKRNKPRKKDINSASPFRHSDVLFPSALLNDAVIPIEILVQGHNVFRKNEPFGVNDILTFTNHPCFQTCKKG